MSLEPLRRLISFVGAMAFALILVDSARCQAVEQPSTSQVIAKLKESQASFRNVFVVVQWEEVWDGVPKSWERQRWTWDSLGRRRSIYQHGLIDDHGQEMPSDEDVEVDSLFDGEVVLDLRSYPHRDRLGGNDDKLPKGYRAAIVSDAAAPTRQALESHRNPLEYLRNVVMRELEKSIADGTAVTIQDADGLLELSYSLSGEVSNSTADHSVVTVDPSRGWSLLRWSTFDSSNKIVSEISQTIEENNGQWIATEGSHKHWADRPADSAPIFDWRFKVTEFVLNNPDFDDSVFAIRLTPDTAVSDTRFNVAYRIGADEATAENLSKLAELAQLEENAKPGVPSVDQTPLQHKGISWLLIVNVFVIAAFVLILAVQRFRRRV